MDNFMLIKRYTVAQI